MKTLELPVILDEKDYQEALARLDQIFDAEPGSDEFYELKILSMEIEIFENENFSIPDANPIDIIELMLEQNGLKQSDLIGIIGDKTTVSKVLNRKRPLTLDMIRSLSAKFQIPVEILIKEYEIDK